jgi:hypothetical protein
MLLAGQYIQVAAAALAAQLLLVLQVTVGLEFNFQQDFKIQQYKDHWELLDLAALIFGLLVVVVQTQKLVVAVAVDQVVLMLVVDKVLPPIQNKQFKHLQILAVAVEEELMVDLHQNVREDLVLFLWHIRQLILSLQLVEMLMH